MVEASVSDKRQEVVHAVALKAGSEIKSVGVDELLAEVNLRKEYHHLLAKAFSEHKVRYVLTELHRCKWGPPVTYGYDRKYDILSMPVQKSLLSLLIAERGLLAKKGLLKHVTIAIVGLSGSGKTTYSVGSIIGALRLLGYSDREVMNIVSNIIFFEAGDFVNYVETSLKERIWVPVVFLDDIGSQISKYWMWIGERWWVYLFSILDHVKDWCGVLLMTATNYNAIPSRIREKVDLIVDATELTYDGYVMNLFSFYKNVGKNRRELVYIDAFPPTALMPRELWRTMIESRRVLGLKRIESLRKAMEKLREKEDREGEVEGGVGEKGEDSNR